MKQWLNRNIWGMTITSLLSDASHEMVMAVLPGFLPMIHVAAARSGWIEGASDAFSSFLKLFAGWYSDKIGHRKANDRHRPVLYRHRPFDVRVRRWMGHDSRWAEW